MKNSIKKEESKILWFIPMSSKIEKYKLVVENKIKNIKDVL